MLWLGREIKEVKKADGTLSLIHPPNVENTKNYLHCKPWTFPTNIYWLFYQCLSFLPFFTNIWLIVLPIFTIFLTIFTDCFTNVYHFYHFLPIFTDCFTNVYHFYHFFTNIYWLFYQYVPFFTNIYKYRGLHGIIIFQLIKQYL